MKFRKLAEALSRRFKRLKPQTPTQETGSSATGRETDSSPFTNLTPPDPNPHKRVQVKDGEM